MSIKTLDRTSAQLKATQDEGVITFYAATFSTEPDTMGDIIDRHAFDEWLERFYKAGRPLPISFAHAAVKDTLDPFRIIGSAPANPEHVSVDDYGLKIVGILDMENEVARQVHRHAKSGVIPGASMAYVPGTEKRLSNGATLITSIPSVEEAGPCLQPANENAVLVSVKEGRTISTATMDKLRAAHDALEALGACTVKASSQEEEAKTKSSETKDEDPETGKSEESTDDVEARIRLLALGL
jgi:HK97 family phage prohead protease